MFCIPTGAKHPEAAWRFIEYITGPKGVEQMARTLTNMPPRRSVAEKLVHDLHQLRSACSGGQRQLLAAPPHQSTNSSSTPSANMLTKRCTASCHLRSPQSSSADGAV